MNLHVCIIDDMSEIHIRGAILGLNSCIKKNFIIKTHLAINDE